MSAGALVFDRAGRLLILKPTYKSGWTIPGGVLETDGETPWTSAVPPGKPGSIRYLFDCGVLMLLVRQLTHFFALMLWIAAALAVVGGMPQLGVAIGIVVVINGGFAFAQEYRADQAGQRLRDLLPVRVTVVRDGSRQEVPAADLVRGSRSSAWPCGSAWTSPQASCSLSA